MTQGSATTHRVTLDVLVPGWLTTIQDLGRRGSERLGVATGGAADQYSAQVANLLVGNERTAPLLEIMGAEFSVQVSAGVLFSVTGTPASVLVDDFPVDLWRPVFAAAGSVITVATPQDGLRSYLAFNGALESGRFLGSVAPDSRMGFPQQLRAGDSVGLDTEYTVFVQPYGVGTWFSLPVPVPDLSAPVWTIDVTDGPETSAVDGIRELMASSTYTVGDKSDHIGVRLGGPVRHPQGLGEIVSHGVPIGAVEIPHSDELIILGRARSLTAGYPIVGVASSAALSLLGQAAPGRKITFRWIDPGESIALYREQRRWLRLLEARVHSAFEAAGLPVRGVRRSARPGGAAPGARAKSA
ncbi:MAG: allophanate hydrolase [Frondihabitans sp.]|nr:allophanate hydrolase [Frondihabitans sp.]